MSKILVVDDSEDNVYLLQEILRRLGHEVATASNGREALDFMEREKADLILLDVMMPRMDGFEVASRLKSREDTKHIPIIFLTAQKKEAGDVAAGLATGADEYITKPFDENELVARVHSMLRIKNLYDEVARTRDTIEEEMKMAQMVQMAMLPKQFPCPNKIRFHARYQATSSIGGDFYDVFDCGEGKVGMMITDVSGHGPSAALIVSMIKAMFYSQTGSRSDPGKVARLLNDQLLKMIPEERYVTLFFGVIDLSSGELSYARAGHPYPVIMRAEDRSLVWLEKGGGFVAISDDFSVEQGVETIRPGDRLLMYSDGLIEVLNDKGALFGFNGLKQSLKKRFHEAGDALLDGLLSDSNDYNAERALADDVAILLAELL